MGGTGALMPNVNVLKHAIRGMLTQVAAHQPGAVRGMEARQETEVPQAALGWVVPGPQSVVQHMFAVRRTQLARRLPSDREHQVQAYSNPRRT